MSYTTRTFPLTGTGDATSPAAIDSVSSKDYQIVKLADGTEGGTDGIAGSAANGLEVDVTRVQGTVAVSQTTLPAGTNNIGDVDIESVEGAVDANNSSTATLGIGAVFTGTGTEVLKYPMIVVNVYADVASATDGLKIQFSSDNTNWFTTQEYTLGAGVTRHLVAPSQGRYFRVLYTNGAGAQSAFRLQSILYPVAPPPRPERIADDADGNTPAIVTKGALLVEKADGGFTPVKGTQNGAIETSLSAGQLTAFGELSVSQPASRIQVMFPYNINPRLVSTSSTGSGSVTHASAHAVVNSGAASSSSGTLKSRKLLNYQPGQGALVRFTAVFTTGVANNTQLVGIGDTNDGFFFGYNGTAFGILRRQGGSDTWVAQTAWNADKADGTGTLPVLDTTKGNVYQIRYQWLGYGAISFWIEEPVSGELVLVHRISYANANTSTSINNPSLPFYAASINTTNTTNVTVKVPSVMAAIEGQENREGVKWNQGNTKSGISNTKTNILTIRCKSTHASVTNRKHLVIRRLAVASDGTKNVRVTLHLNTTLGGSPSYTDVNTNYSVVDYDTAGTTITGGYQIASFLVSKTESANFELNNIDIDLYPGETLTIAAETVVAGNNEITCGITWAEVY